MSIKFLSSDITEKEPISIELAAQEDDNQKKYKALLQKCLNQILDAENIIVLAGSGTSLTFNSTESARIAPSMVDLWHACREMNKKIFDDIRDC